MSASEDLPYIELNLAGTEFRATPLNAQLYTFAGQSILENGMTVDNGIYDHIFFETHEPNGDIIPGTYVFKPEIVQQMGNMMLEHGFPCRINQREVQPCDVSAYNQFVEQNAEYEAEQMDDFIPDWFGDEG